MKTKMYILKGDKPQAAADVLQWAAWFESYDRTIALDDITNKVYVSTVFLGINHNFHGKGEPVLWETMIFNGPRTGYQRRYTSKRDALKGHKHAVKIARGEIPND